MNDTKCVNKDSLAEMLGVSLPTVGQFIKEGLPVLSEGSNGKEYRINPSLAIHWFAGRQASKDCKIEATGWRLVALGVGVAVQAFQGSESETRAFIGRIYRDLKKCEPVNRDDFFLEVGRHLDHSPEIYR